MFDLWKYMKRRSARGYDTRSVPASPRVPKRTQSYCAHRQGADSSVPGQTGAGAAHEYTLRVQREDAYVG
jgi:hypothetical protein